MFNSVPQIAQQLPEYGVMFHRVGREKRPVVGELVLGVCAKGIIVYEMKNHIRTVTRRFLWRETDSISTGVNLDVRSNASQLVCDRVPNRWHSGVFQRRKLIIECGGPSGKKHGFVTESSKIAQYLLNLCSAQHKFHSEMTSRQLNHTMIPGREPRLLLGPWWRRWVHTSAHWNLICSIRWKVHVRVPGSQFEPEADVVLRGNAESHRPDVRSTRFHLQVMRWPDCQVRGAPASAEGDEEGDEQRAPQGAPWPRRLQRPKRTTVLEVIIDHHDDYCYTYEHSAASC